MVLPRGDIRHSTQNEHQTRSHTHMNDKGAPHIPPPHTHLLPLLFPDQSLLRKNGSRHEEHTARDDAKCLLEPVVDRRLEDLDVELAVLRLRGLHRGASGNGSVNREDRRGEAIV